VPPKKRRKPNKASYAQQKRTRRAAKAGVESEPYNARTIVKLYGSICHICKEQIDLKAARQVGRKGWERGLHLDHVIPISKGGADLIPNIRPSHGLCNIRKNAREI